MMYYYKRRSNPLKWVIIFLIFMALGALVYWFYFNYFSKIDFSKPDDQTAEVSEDSSAVKILGGEISQLSGDVQVSINQNSYEKAIANAILHQGDKIRTGANSLAILTLEDNTKIRLGADTEIILEILESDNILIRQIKGRIYNNFSGQGQYQVVSLGAKVTTLGTRFEVITNETSQYLAILVMENKLKLEITENNEVIISSILNTNEKALVDFKAAKKDLFKIDTIDQEILAGEEWYKWNFDLDQGLAIEDPDQEPDYQEISDSLQLSLKETVQGINLSWIQYKLTDFQSYKIIWSGDNQNLKYPDNEVVKSITDKTITEFLDTKINPDRKYYYRICVVKANDKIACGNVAEIKTAVKDSIPPAAPSLSAAVSAAGVNLSWSVNNDDDFKEYRVLKSISDSNLSAPTIGYLLKLGKGSESYLDKEVNITSVGNVYYRVCSLDNTLNFSCSNIITVENGAIK